jgi:HAD superfamily hydrolase (TIGR01459 family)
LPKSDSPSDLPARLAGLSTLAPRYRAILSDVWGVLHNGVTATPGADAALARFRADGGRVVLITNAPRPSPPIVAKLDRMGVRRDAYDAIVSSGDMTRAMLAPYRGHVVHQVSPPEVDEALFDGLGLVRGPAEEAEAVVVTDMEDDDDTPEIYAERMRLWLARGLPLICANPDKVVEKGNKVIYCAGAIADLYAEAGGTVLMAGKPYVPIYEQALKRAEAAAGTPIAREDVLAIGDSARTDATGAAAFGLDLLFIAGPIHAADFGGDGASGQGVRDLLAPTGANLVGYMPRLVW